VDDYAHHPTEVAATIAAARSIAAGRVLAVFQPHLFSRTAMFAEEFGAALAEADAVGALEVYPARERAEDHPGVSGLSVARAAAARAGGRPVYWLADLATAERLLDGLLAPDDVCLVMGAGDVDRLAHALVKGDGG
jgi:UDP-N-acetylmuramate--alanine ligase